MLALKQVFPHPHSACEASYLSDLLMNSPTSQSCFSLNQDHVSWPIFAPQVSNKQSDSQLDGICWVLCRNVQCLNAHDSSSTYSYPPPPTYISRSALLSPSQSFPPSIITVSLCHVLALNTFISVIILKFANARVVKESGLVCVSYGKDNDDKVFVRKQIEAGVDAVIVDSVLAIRNELTSGGLQKIIKSQNGISNGANGSNVPQGANGTSLPGEK